MQHQNSKNCHFKKGASLKFVIPSSCKSDTGQVIVEGKYN